MKIAHRLAETVLGMFLLSLFPSAYAGNLSTGKIYACVYLPTKPVSPLPSFNFTLSLLQQSMGSNTSSIDFLLITPQQPGVTCGPMGNISGNTVGFFPAVASYWLLSYSVKGQPYSGSTEALVFLFSPGGSGTGCFASYNGLINLSHGNNTELCYSSSLCSGQTDRCVNLNQDMYVIFHPISSSVKQPITPTKITVNAKTQISITQTANGTAKANTVEWTFPK